MPQVAFTTLGCKVNQFETDTIEGLFRSGGYEVVPFTARADVYVINTCSVTQLGEKKSRQLIRRAVRINPDATVVVTGCYAQVAPEKVRSIAGVDVIIGTADRNRIVEMVHEAVHNKKQVQSVTDIMAARDFEDIPLWHTPGRTRAFLKIQEGCTNFCTYCIIPYARGPLRSRPLSSVTAEAAKLVAAGFKEIVLTGIHLGAYGRDGNGLFGLADAVKALLGMDDLVRLRLGSLESIEVSDELLMLMQQDKRLCPNLHLPLQSGNDTVLQRMNRHYTTEEFRRVANRIRTTIDDVAITTDVIVGFPGETPSMFESSLEFIEEMAFARIHVFPYSPRNGTPAASYAGQVSEEEKKMRADILQNMADDAALAFNRRFVGRKMTVLLESMSGQVADGLTGNYIRVYTPAEGQEVGTVGSLILGEPYRDGMWGHAGN